MNKEEEQKKLIEFQILNQQLNQIQQQLLTLRTQAEDIKNLQNSLDEIKKTKLGNKILAPLSSGILVEAELKNNKEVIISLGAEITMKKSIDEAKEFIQDQEKQLDLIISQLEKDLQQYAIAYSQLEEEISQTK